MAVFRDDIMHSKEEFNNETGNQYTVNDQVSVEELNYNIENGLYAARTATEAKEIADNVVSYATQTPTDAQKQQARENIGASAKATNPTLNNLASLDAEGNVKDSGIASGNVATKVSNATTNNIASLDANGNIKDSGIASGNVVTTNTEQTITSNKKLANNAALIGEAGNLLLGSYSDGVFVGGMTHDTMFAGSRARPTYASPTNESGTDIALITDVNSLSMMPVNTNQIYDIFGHTTAMKEETFLAPANGYVCVWGHLGNGSVVELQAGNGIIFSTKGLASGQSFSVYIPVSKGQTVRYELGGAALGNIWQDKFVYAGGL